jgi:esterase/lipase
MILLILFILAIILFLWGERVLILEESLSGFAIIMLAATIVVFIIALLANSMYPPSDKKVLNKAEQYSLIDFKKATPELKQKIYNCIKQYNQEIKELQEKNKSILYDLFIHDSITNIKPIILPKDVSEKKD